MDKSQIKNSIRIEIAGKFITNFPGITTQVKKKLSCKVQAPKAKENCSQKEWF